MNIAVAFSELNYDGHARVTPTRAYIRRSRSQRLWRHSFHLRLSDFLDESLVFAVVQ